MSEDDSDIAKVRKVNKDDNDINKAIYQFNINYDPSIKYYSTRLSIDLEPLDSGEFKKIKIKLLLTLSVIL